MSPPKTAAEQRLEEPVIPQSVTRRNNPVAKRTKATEEEIDEKIKLAPPRL